MKRVVFVSTCLFVMLGVLGIPTVHANADVVAVKNFRQVLEYLYLTTGVNPATADIAQYYAQGSTRLPKEGSVEEVSAPMLLTFASLSALFCKNMIQADSLVVDVSKRQAHSKVDFKKVPSAALTDEVRKSVIEEYAGLFWRRSPSELELASLNHAITQALMGRPDVAVENSNALLVPCTAVASSLESIIF